MQTEGELREGLRGEPISINLYIATLPEGEDPASLAQRDPGLLQRIIDEAKPAGVWRAEYLAEHPELDTEGWVR